MLTSLKSLVFPIVLTGAIAHAQCPVNTVFIKGRVQNVPPNSRVRAQLIFAKNQRGASAEATLNSESFRIPIEFITQSSRPVLSNLRPKCDRRPQAAIVKLLEGDQELDRVTLDFRHDFKMTDPTAFTSQSEVILNDHSK
jgi:predicted oxidoreductase (fatty acid repression mutant protein)